MVECGVGEMRGVTADLSDLRRSERIFEKMRRALVAKVRRGLLERRVARWPLLAEELIREEMERRPRYYAGGEEEQAETVGE